MSGAADALERAYRTSAPRCSRRSRGACTATSRWPRTSSRTPSQPRRALDRKRHECVARAHAPELVVADATDDPEAEMDRSSLDGDQLKMIFSCCHPALPPAARMALTRRSVAGLTVPEIARAFLSGEDAMERRLTRARRKITDARIQFRVPPDELLAERLAGVLRVVLLVFTEGHMATRGDFPVRGELCDEAIRLARLLLRLLPDEPEAQGLLALLLITDARRAARVDADGALVSLEDQDRATGPPRERRRASRCSSARCASAGPGRTSSRRRSPRCTRRRRASPRPTGRRSPGSAPSWPGTTRHRADAAYAEAIALTANEAERAALERRRAKMSR